MNTNSKFKKAVAYKVNQERLRKKALKSGVNLIAPETIFLSKDTKFGKNVTINPYVVIGKKVRIGNNVEILSFSHIEGAKIDNKVTIGPYARIREGTHLMSGVKIGNFVETKKSKIKSKSKVNHLSYIGDSEIGKNTSLVAPVRIKKKSIVGAGSVITRDVKEKSLALERSEQEEIENYKRKK